jgi:integrase
MIDDYVVSLAAVGQREATLRLRRYHLTRMARELGCPPEEVTGEMLVNWFGRYPNWVPETRRGYRGAVRGFFTWAYRTGRVPAHLSDELPKVRQPKAPPRPAPERAWRAALLAADPRTTLMLRLAGESGLAATDPAG